MKLFTRKTVQELAFLVVLILGGYAIAKAQNDQSVHSKKVVIEVEVTENGSKSTTVIEKQMDREGVDRELDEMIQEIEVILEEAVNDLEETDLEIIIRKNGNAAEPRFRKHMLAIPDAPFEWESKSEPRAFLGVVAVEVEAEDAQRLKIEKGARIANVVEGSAAERAGLKKGDVITVLDGVQVGSFSDVAKAIRSNEPGDRIEIELIRDGEKKTVNAELGRQQSRSYAYSFDWDSDDPNVRPPHPPGPPDHAFVVPHFETLIEKSERKAFLGIVGKSVENDGGVRLQEVFEGSTASEMGLKEGDVVHSINGEETKDIKELVAILAEMDVNDEVKIEFERDGKKEKAKGKLMPIDREMKGRFEPRGLKEYVYRIEVNELSEDEIKELNKKSNASLDESNSLEMDHFTIAPNPGNGVFILDMGLASKGDLDIEVFDANGRSIYSNAVKGDGDIVLERIDITDQASGMYYISVKQNGKGKINRVIKQ